MIHPLRTMNALKFISIHLIIVEQCQTGPKWWIQQTKIGAMKLWRNKANFYYMCEKYFNTTTISLFHICTFYTQSTVFVFMYNACVYAYLIWLCLYLCFRDAREHPLYCKETSFSLRHFTGVAVTQWFSPNVTVKRSFIGPADLHW